MLSPDRSAAGTGADRDLAGVTGAAVRRVVTAFLTSASEASSLLVLEGEPGIGKTTHLLAAVDEARRRGIRVFLAHPTESGSQLAYATLADLVGDLHDDEIGRLPSPQRLALERVLSRTSVDELPTDPAATAAALSSVLNDLSQQGQLLLAVDELHWVDASSRHALAAAARRLPAAVSIIATVRTGAQGDPASWLRPPRPTSLTRLTIPPMSRAEVEAMLSTRVPRALSRVDLEHVNRVANGNPFFALELARTLEEREDRTAARPLPNTLAEVVSERVADASPDVRRALLAVACSAEPTIDLVREALALSPVEVGTIVEDTERRGLLEVDARQLRFTHPLLAAGVYADAGSSARRDMHRRLGECVSDPEQRARHLAMASIVADASTLQALDDAATAARVRGAPAAAAELVSLTIDLGGEDPERVLRLAQHLLDAGDADRAREELTTALDRVHECSLRARITIALAQVHLDADSFREAASLLKSVLAESAADPELQIAALTRLSYAYLNEGRFEDSRETIEQAVDLGERHGPEHLLAQALGMSIMVSFMRGDGFDEARMQRALDLEDSTATVSIAFSPSVHAALLTGWSGRLEEAAHRLGVLRRQCNEHGREHAEIFLDFQAALIMAWRGQVDELSELAEGMEVRADQLGADQSLAIARTVSCVAAAIAGEVPTTRTLAEQGQRLFEQCGVPMVARTPRAALGFLELSRGDNEASLAALTPLLPQARAFHRTTEVMTSSFVPDAVEALITLGRLDEAEPLVEMLEANGRRLDRAWMLATGGRCRSLLLAARGDLPTALAELVAAMEQHDRVPMPLERARTLLVLGQVHRRLRHKDAATAAFTGALQIFDDLGAILWSERCRAELARVPPGRSYGTLLSSSEQQVAELAAGGMTNREVAATLFISPKTVEANLAKVYRKLGIRSRAELGRWMSEHDVNSPTRE